MFLVKQNEFAIKQCIVILQFYYGMIKINHNWSHHIILAFNSTLYRVYATFEFNSTLWYCDTELRRITLCGINA